MTAVEISELVKIDADRHDGVSDPATGISFLLFKQLAEPVGKDWAAWDAAHDGKAPKKAPAKADAADAVARAKQTIADHKAGKKVSAAELKNAHEVHEAHLAHEARLKAQASKKEVAKGQRDCPKCEKSYDADHKGSTCENCGTDLPDAPAAKAADDAVDCPTCEGDGKVMGGKRDCPDCSASGKVSPAKAKSIAAKSVPVLRLDGAENWTPEQFEDFRARLEEAVKSLRPTFAAGTAKSEIAQEGAPVDTVTQETGGLTKAVEDAIAKANAPLLKEITDLKAELAKVKAAPVPGGLVLSRNVQVKAPGAAVNEDYAAKAAHYQDMAETVTDRVTADGYRKLAREAREKAVTPTS